MALPGKTHYKVDEAAERISALAGERVSVDQMLDWIAQNLFRVEIPVSGKWLIPEDTPHYLDTDRERQRHPEWKFTGLVQVEITVAQVQDLIRRVMGGSSVCVDRGVVSGKRVKVSKYGAERDIWFCWFDILIPASEVDAFIAQHIPEAAPQKSTSSSAWPWGDYETKDLRIMADAIEKFWVRYIPGEPDTAPTNKMVQDWLVAQGVPLSKAETMASIMRPADLPFGRRRG